MACFELAAFVIFCLVELQRIDYIHSGFPICLWVKLYWVKLNSWDSCLLL